LRGICGLEPGTLRPELNDRAVMDALSEQAKAVQHGDLKQPVAMLQTQATVLQSLFIRLLERGMGAEYRDHLETFLKLALKAQNQSRMTLETLAAIQNPPVVYAKQANIAQNQQVNNGEFARAREIQNRPNELLERQHGERLEFGTPAAAGGIDPRLETVDAFHGTEDGRG
jgi:hypothetical protein